VPREEHKKEWIRIDREEEERLSCVEKLSCVERLSWAE
jgi:hypothetical protein